MDIERLEEIRYFLIHSFFCPGRLSGKTVAIEIFHDIEKLIDEAIEVLKKERTNSFVDIRSEALSDSEIEGVEKLFDMILSLRQQVQLRNSFEKEMSRNEMPNGAKLCPFCAGEATMRPEGDYWEITCDDCGVSKQGSTFDEAWNEWNLRRL